MFRPARRTTSITVVCLVALLAATAVVLADGRSRGTGHPAQVGSNSASSGVVLPDATNATSVTNAPVSAAALAIRSSLATPSTTGQPTTTAAATGHGKSAPARGGSAPPTTVAVQPTGTTTASTASATTTAKTSGAAGSVMFGVVTDTTAELQSFDSDAGRKATLSGSYDSFAYDSDFDASAASALSAQGVQPMITWEPWDPGVGTATQPAYSLAAIVNGNYDSYLTRWASEIKAWGQPLWLRFAHEMNGNWYPWGAGVNGNTPAEYVAAWRHVHDIFQQVGATDVTWVWTPNVLTGATPTLASLYPGDAYVNVIGVDGYNWGTTQSWGSTWQTPSQVFGPTISALEQLSSRPIMIGETASTEVGGSKATWITQFFSYLASNPRIKAFVWFNLDKETDWRIESSPAAQSAFAAGVANARYT